MSRIGAVIYVPELQGMLEVYDGMTYTQKVTAEAGSPAGGSMLSRRGGREKPSVGDSRQARAQAWKELPQQC